LTIGQNSFFYFARKLKNRHNNARFSVTNKTMFNQMKDLYKMQKQAKAMKKMLKTIEVEAEEGGALVVVNAAQEVVSIELAEEKLQPVNKKQLEKEVMIALQRATKKAQEVAAEKMKPIMGDMGLPGGQ
jgi:DNA-binding protein YbaB